MKSLFKSVCFLCWQCAHCAPHNIKRIFSHNIKICILLWCLCAHTRRWEIKVECQYWPLADTQGNKTDFQTVSLKINPLLYICISFQLLIGSVFLYTLLKSFGDPQAITNQTIPLVDQVCLNKSITLVQLHSWKILQVPGHNRLPSSGSERGSETLGHIRGEDWISTGSARAEGTERLPFIEQNQERTAVYSKPNVRAQQVSPSWISPSSTHHWFGKASWLWGWLSFHPQSVDGTDHQGFMEEYGFVKWDMCSFFSPNFVHISQYSPTRVC